MNELEFGSVSSPNSTISLIWYRIALVGGKENRLIYGNEERKTEINAT